MDYFKIYYSIIQRSKLRTTPIEFIENHHITPKCLGGSDSEENLAKLTPEELYDLYWNQNLSLSNIAKIYNCSLKVTHKWFRIRDIKTRAFSTRGLSFPRKS